MNSQSAVLSWLRSAPSLCLAVSLVLCITAAETASAAAPPLKVVRTPLAKWIAARRHIAADTLVKFTTGALRKNRFRTFVLALADQNWAQVATLAGELSYRVVARREARRWFAMAYDRRGRDPTIVVNLNAHRELILGAPHVPFETGTAEQAILLLRDAGGRAAIFAGAHRCASATYTACDGTTSVCGASEPYRDSDVGHNPNTLYHIAHEELAAHWPATLIVSLHGMANDNDGVKTSVIVSNGINANDDAKETAATRLRLFLGRQMPPKGTVVSCNLGNDDKHGARRLCGTTNVQGRLVNGDANVCLGSVSQGTGRFIHLEQDPGTRDPYANDWQNIDQHPFHNALVAGLKRVSPKVP